MFSPQYLQTLMNLGNSPQFLANTHPGAQSSTRFSSVADIRPRSISSLDVTHTQWFTRSNKPPIRWNKFPAVGNTSFTPSPSLRRKPYKSQPIVSQQRAWLCPKILNRGFRLKPYLSLDTIPSHLKNLGLGDQNLAQASAYPALGKLSPHSALRPKHYHVSWNLVYGSKLRACSNHCVKEQRMARPLTRVEPVTSSLRYLI